MSKQYRGMALLAVLVAVLAAVAAGLGVVARGDGAYETVTSVRGITYRMATDGIYAYNAEQVVAEGVGWDVFTLFLAVPAMAVAAWFTAAGSFRGRLAAAGLFGYFLYQYLEYVVTWAFGPLFPLFIAIYAASLAGIVWLGVSLAADGIALRFDRRFPRRAFATLNVGLAALLALMWAARIATGLGGDLEAAGLRGETTMVVQALDLGLVLPSALLISVLAWRRSDAGYVLAAAYAVTGVAMGAAIAAMLLSAWAVTGELAVPPLVIFGAYVIGSAIVAVRIYRSAIASGRRIGLEVDVRLTLPA
jgi:hypothetical protein